MSGSGDLMNLTTSQFGRYFEAKHEFLEQEKNNLNIFKYLNNINDVKLIIVSELTLIQVKMIVKDITEEPIENNKCYDAKIFFHTVKQMDKAINKKYIELQNND
jgi:hypothetical protein